MIDTPETFDQSALIPATDADGNLYCISLGTNTLILAYNKTMIEAAGVALPKDNMTWDELVAYGKELKAALPEGVAPYVPQFRAKMIGFEHHLHDHNLH